MTFFKRLAIPLPLTAAKLDVYNQIKLHMLLDWLIQASNEFQRSEASATHLPAEVLGSSMNEYSAVTEVCEVIVVRISHALIFKERLGAFRCALAAALSMTRLVTID